jgi:hypothetical protein
MSNSDAPSSPGGASEPGPLAALEFMLGEWEAISRPGEATGGFTFTPALLSRTIVRTNYADHPASGERPAFRHEDLMVIYVDDGQVLRAEYYDSEGHTIRYEGQLGAAGEVAFVSTPSPAGPGFRLTYRQAKSGLLDGPFEIALPQQPGTYAPYLAWSARKRTPAEGRSG